MRRSSAGWFGEAAAERCSQRGCSTSCTATANTSSSIQQGEPSQHPQGFPPLTPPAPNPFKTTLATWGFNATERLEGKCYYVLTKSAPCSSCPGISPGPGAVSRSWTLPARVFSKQRALTDAPSPSSTGHLAAGFGEERCKGHISTFLYFR